MSGKEGVTLAFQSMRTIWRFLCLVELGLLASVIVACTVPLYSRVAMTASLRATLASYGQNNDIVVQGESHGIPAQDISQMGETLDQEFHKPLGPYLLPGQFSLQSPMLAIVPPPSFVSPLGDSVGMIGVDTTRAASHLKFVQGRIPATVMNGNTIEVALRADEAAAPAWGVGTVIPVRIAYWNKEGTGQTLGVIQVSVVGLFNLVDNNDPFWHGEDFKGRPAEDVNFFDAFSLASNTALISLLGQTFAPDAGQTTSPFEVIWYYSLNSAHLQIDQIDTILQELHTIQIENANSRLMNKLEHVQTYTPTDSLTSYQQRLPVAQFPIASLTTLVLCLILFFTTLMAGILVDRQSTTLALLRSRGAGRGQIVGALVTQSVVLGLFALVAGPLLAVFLTYCLARIMLTGLDQSALKLVSGNPFPIAFSVSLFALVTVCVMVLSMILAIWGMVSHDMLALRREAARSTQHPLWQRLHLDALAIIAALLFAGFSTYLASSSALDDRLRLLFLAPLNLLSALCLLLAAMLLLLRGFPLLLRCGARLVTHLRGAALLIALTQMARSPRQPVRMILLLSLATAFTIFTFVFNASQMQRVQDVADYQAMADFSGTIPVVVMTPQQLTRGTLAYRQLPGVFSASLGYTTYVRAGGTSLNLPINFKAVDGTTFAQTARWSAQDSSQSLPGLMQQLVAMRAPAIRAAVVPAIVDATTWNELHLTSDALFTLNFALADNAAAPNPNDIVTFKAVTSVQHIPTSDNSAIPGVMVDYLTFATIFTHNYTTNSGFSSPLNTVWLRTSDNPYQLNLLRAELRQGYLSLSPLYDRRLIAAQLAHEPLNLTLFGLLLLGTTTAFLLALFGNLVASWLSARSRLLSFAALRALGAAPRHIASALIWEQVIVYTTALLIGCLFGWLLSALALPSLIFTSALPGQVPTSPQNATFYAGQTIPPVQIIFPSTLWVTLAGLILFCALALSLMMRVIVRLSIARVLQLNED